MVTRPHDAYVVFVSHSHRDRWIARQIARSLEDRGVATWLDEKRVDGGRVPDEVKRGIRACDELCVLVSSASLASDWVRHEIGAADVLDKRITLLMDKLSVRDRPETWITMPALDLNEFERYAEDVKRRAEEEGS
jgi:hypothetical protein